MHPMKILVFSDSHGELSFMEQTVSAQLPDQIIHLGDRREDAEALAELFPRIPVCMVSGNCDYDFVNPPVIVTQFGGVRFLVTHGHTLGVKGGPLRLLYAAEERQVQAALFGHTHSACYEPYHGIHVLNPGAAGGCSPSCGLIEISDGKITSCRIVRQT